MGGHGPILVVVCGPVDRDQQRPVAVAALVVEIADDLGGAAVGERHGECQALDLETLAAVSPAAAIPPSESSRSAETRSL
jgi:hypothetical protein